MCSESEYVLEYLGKDDEIETDLIQETVKYKNKIYNINEIIGISDEQKIIEEAGLKQITAANAESDEDKKILAELDENNKIKIRMIIVEETTENKTVKAVIPSGFYYVTGTPTTGLVISDKFEDDNNNDKEGNQFVWIPCNRDEVTYKKHEYKLINESDKNKIVLDADSNWPTYSYRCYGNWTDNDEREIKDASVNKYGGFYVGRYESGTPKNADFYNDTDGSTYWQGAYDKDVSDKLGDNTNKPDINKTYADTYKSKNEISQGNEELLPVSKKNMPAWNYITQQTSNVVSKNMYKNSKSVTSYLIDSYAYDTIIQWIENKGISLDKCSEWGNYYYTKSIINGLYARHQAKIANDNSWRWFPAYIYNFGTYKKENESVEIATGSNEQYKIQNIYDLAGNMWEWTTETMYSENKDQNIAVLRGGSFSNGGNDYNVAIRYGGNSASNYCNFHIGFRVVLYIK